MKVLCGARIAFSLSICDSTHQMVLILREAATSVLEHGGLGWRRRGQHHTSFICSLRLCRVFEHRTLDLWSLVDLARSFNTLSATSHFQTPVYLALLQDRRLLPSEWHYDALASQRPKCDLYFSAARNWRLTRLRYRSWPRARPLPWDTLDARTA